MREHLESHGFYMTRAFWEPEQHAEKAAEPLANVDYDSMVGMGLSGALVIPSLARLLGKHWLIVRKDDDGSHSDRLVEGSLGRRWIFVDDLVDRGGTIRKVHERVTNLLTMRGFESTFVGAYLYNGPNFYAPGDIRDLGGSVIDFA